jgi:FkbH-like protein
MAEPVRLVIWDLDETFWSGTLTEGGIAYSQANHDRVVRLAHRGIVSSICSKNDFAAVQAILTQHGIWDFFVFPDIDWQPKGPRLRALIDAIQLRPASVLFIDDNALNRAEAEHCVPGLRTASEAVIPGLLDDGLLAGKPDPTLTRLRQYRQLQSQHTARAAAGDTESFLRDSAITVSITHDIDDHLDRAVELINRTNQLNFTKSRLPEDAIAARAALARQLASFVVKAGLVSVRDRYGDYGICGLYVLHHSHGHPARLVHFCFSCRILNMGVETWVYRLLGSPALAVRQPVLADVARDTRTIDWINRPGTAHTTASRAGDTLDYVLLRGGCDIHTIAHYFATNTKRVVAELHSVRQGFEPAISHSVMLRHAVRGVSRETVDAAKPFGYLEDDFHSLVADPPAVRSAAWVFSFVHDNQTMLYRHGSTQDLLPVRFYKSVRLTDSYIGRAPEEVGADQATLDHLGAAFTYVGPISPELFVENLTMVMERAPPGVRVFVLLGNELAMDAQGDAVPNGTMISRNALIRQALAPFPQAETVGLADCLGPDTPPPLGNHYDRMTYYRIYKHILARMTDGVAQGDGLERGHAA